MDITRKSELSPDLTMNAVVLTKVLGNLITYKIASWTFWLKLTFKLLPLFPVHTTVFAKIVIIPNFYVISIFFMESEKFCAIRTMQNSDMSSFLEFPLLNYLKKEGLC